MKGQFLIDFTGDDPTLFEHERVADRWLGGDLVRIRRGGVPPAYEGLRICPLCGKACLRLLWTHKMLGERGGPMAPFEGTVPLCRSRSPNKCSNVEFTHRDGPPCLLEFDCRDGAYIVTPENLPELLAAFGRKRLE